MIYHTSGLPARRRFYHMDAYCNGVTLERVIAADAPQIMEQPNLIKQMSVPVTVINQSKFSTAKEFDVFIYRTQSKLRNKYKDHALEFYIQYGTRTKQFTKEERYLLGTRMRLRRLSFEKTLSFPLQSVSLVEKASTDHTKVAQAPAIIGQNAIGKIAFAPL